jgi:hypothetical protein
MFWLAPRELQRQREEYERRVQEAAWMQERQRQRQTPSRPGNRNW